MRVRRSHRLQVGILFCALVASACGSSSGPTQPELDGGASDAAGASDGGVGIEGGSSDASVPPPATCTKNADCRLFESTCERCECLALTTTQPDPTCQGAQISCFAPSCTNKTAICDGAACTIVASP